MSEDRAPLDANHASDADAPAGAGWRGKLRVALGVALVGAAALFAARALATQQDAWAQLRIADAPAIAGIFVLLLWIAVNNGIVLRELVAHFGVRLPWRAWLGITLVSSMMNLISPLSGAAAIRALYLKRIFGVPLTTFGSMLAAGTACSLAASGSLAATVLLALGVPGGNSGMVALAASVGLVLAIAVALLVAPAVNAPERGLLAALGRLYSGWRSVSRDRVLLGKLAGINVVNALAHAGVFVLAFRMAGFSGGWLVPVASSAFARIGALVAITPAGLGVFEAFGAVSAQIVGASPASALLAVLIVRVFSVALALVGGAIFSPILVRVRATREPAVPPAP